MMWRTRASPQFWGLALGAGQKVKLRYVTSLTVIHRACVIYSMPPTLLWLQLQLTSCKLCNMHAYKY